MCLDVLWIWVFVKLVVDVSLNSNLVVGRLLAEKTWEEGIVAVAVACHSLITHRLVFTVT
jgi:hypothetical protein